NVPNADEGGSLTFNISTLIRLRHLLPSKGEGNFLRFLKEFELLATKCKPCHDRQTMTQRTDDIRIAKLKPLMPPAILLEEYPLSDSSAQFIAEQRKLAQEIIQKKHDKLIVIAGPCSIHDVNAALDYAEKL